MELVDIYQYLLFIVTSIFTWVQYKKYTTTPLAENKNNTDILGLILCLFFAILIGLRPETGRWADSGNYAHAYYLNEGTPFYFDINNENVIFDNLYNFWCSYSLGISNLFLLCAILYFGCTYIACKKWFPNDTLLAYLAFLGAFSTYSYSFNGIKAGVAGAIFLVGMAYYEKKWLSIILVLISWGFHHSMQLPVAAYVLTMFFKNPKWYFYGWFGCCLIALLHISIFQNLFASLTDEKGAGYLMTTEESEYFQGAGGFRLDFILYSAAPIWIGYKLVMQEGRHVSKLYSALLHMYLCTNGIWMLCMYASSSNRIAYLSWFMYPFVLLYPFIKENINGSSILRGGSQHQMLAKVSMYHLGFTLFMVYIYYGFLKDIIR